MCVPVEAWRRDPEGWKKLVGRWLSVEERRRRKRKDGLIFSTVNDGRLGLRLNIDKVVPWRRRRRRKRKLEKAYCLPSVFPTKILHCKWGKSLRGRRLGEKGQVCTSVCVDGEGNVDRDHHQGPAQCGVSREGSLSGDQQPRPGTEDTGTHSDRDWAMQVW